MVLIPLEDEYSKLRRLVRKLCPVRDIGCEVQGPVGGYVCTRKKGHKGPHLACGTKEAYEIWEDESEEVKEN